METKRSIPCVLMLAGMMAHASDEHLVSIEHRRITAIAEDLLLKSNPNLSKKDLKAKIIVVMSVANSPYAHNADISVEFVISSTERLVCEPWPADFLATLDARTRQEIGKEGCIMKGDQYYVRFNSLNPTETVRIQRESTDAHAPSSETGNDANPVLNPGPATKRPAG